MAEVHEHADHTADKHETSDNKLEIKPCRTQRCRALEHVKEPTAPMRGETLAPFMHPTLEFVNGERNPSTAVIRFDHDGPRALLPDKARVTLADHGDYAKKDKIRVDYVVDGLLEGTEDVQDAQDAVDNDAKAGNHADQVHSVLLLVHPVMRTFDALLERISGALSPIVPFDQRLLFATGSKGHCAELSRGVTNLSENAWTKSA